MACFIIYVFAKAFGDASIRRGCHGTRHIVFPNRWRVSFDRTARHLSFCAGVVESRFKEARKEVWKGWFIMNMISYWKDKKGSGGKAPTPFYQSDDGCSFIYGWYAQGGQNASRALGVYYPHNNFPRVQRENSVVLSPLVVPESEALLLLRGLLNDLLNKKEFAKASKVLEALSFLQTEE